MKFQINITKSETPTISHRKKGSEEGEMYTDLTNIPKDYYREDLGF